MPGDFRTFFSRYAENPRIRNDQAVRTQNPQFPQILPGSFQIPVVSQNVHRHINLYPVFMGKQDPCLHILHGKVFCLCSQAKGLSADIHRVRAVEHRDL